MQDITLLFELAFTNIIYVESYKFILPKTTYFVIGRHILLLFEFM